MESRKVLFPFSLLVTQPISAGGSRDLLSCATGRRDSRLDGLALQQSFVE